MYTPFEEFWSPRAVLCPQWSFGVKIQSVGALIAGLLIWWDSRLKWADPIATLVFVGLVSYENMQGEGWGGVQMKIHAVASQSMYNVGTEHAGISTARVKRGGRGGIFIDGVCVHNRIDKS